jgi:hypothetical protein
MSTLGMPIVQEPGVEPGHIRERAARGILKEFLVLKIHNF